MTEDDPFTGADWTEGWKHPAVTDAEWRELVAALDRQTARWSDTMSQQRQWNEGRLKDAIGSIAHLAYHLGAIRQLVAATAGPSAKEAKRFRV